MRVKSAPTPVRIITHNIRYATKNPSTGEEPWPVRLPLILENLQFHAQHSPETFVCLQEVLHGQLQQVLSGLNAQNLSVFEAPPNTASLSEEERHDLSKRSRDEPEWAFLGVGRDDGKMAGEYEPILYRPSVYRLTERVHIWLSETPHVPGSKGWDAASVRMATLGVFIHRQSGKEIVVCNTHLDDQGHTSRREGAWILCELLQKYVPTPTAMNDSLAGNTVKESDRVIVLAGDLNSTPHGEAYTILSGQLNSRSQSRVHFFPHVLDDDPPSHQLQANLLVPHWHFSNAEAGHDPQFSSSSNAPRRRSYPGRLSEDSQPQPQTYLHPQSYSQPHPRQHSQLYTHSNQSQQHLQPQTQTHLQPSYRPQSPGQLHSHRSTDPRQNPFSQPERNQEDRTQLDLRDSRPSTPRTSSSRFSQAPSDYGFPFYPTRINSPVTDVREHTRLSYGDTMTFTGFRGKKRDKQHLDFIFVGPTSSALSSLHHNTAHTSSSSRRPSKGLQDPLNILDPTTKSEEQWKVTSYAVLPNRFDEGVWMSDHRAVVADLLF